MIFKETSSRKTKRCWGMRFQKLLLYTCMHVIIFTSELRCIRCFQHVCNGKRNALRNLKVTLAGSRWDLSLHTAAIEDSYVEESPSQNNDFVTSRSTTHIVFPGGGIFFYYQAGLVCFLREKYDLSTCTFSGASAGALTATLTAAGIDFYEATDLALKLAEDAGVWDRKGGLQGIWGPMIEEWLDSLLPASIESLQDRITLLVTPVPTFGKTKISKFRDREDLIRCNMASVHLPWFLDGKLTSNFRDRPHIDGSFLSKEDDYMRKDGDESPVSMETIFLDWSKDPAMSSKGGFDIVEALSPDGIYGLIEQGKLYGKIMEDQGKFDSLEKLT